MKLETRTDWASINEKCSKDRSGYCKGEMTQ